MEFIDIRGASGSAYRFRRWPAAGRHPPIAGNFVIVAEESRDVLALGVIDDLSRAPALLQDGSRQAGLFTRLNISRRTREAEHADLALLHPDAASELAARFEAPQTA